MKLDIHDWMNRYLDQLRLCFPNRIWFAGLQGSYARGEAGEGSDIDAVVILDRVSPADLSLYSDMLDRLPYREKACGFICGKDELFHWDPADRLALCLDTLPFTGSLEEVLAATTRRDVLRSIQSGCCNLYHLCAHNMVHEKSPDILRSLYKSALFVLRTIAYWQTGRYEPRPEGLRSLLSPEDQALFLQAWQGKQASGFPADSFPALSAQLLAWASGWIHKSAAGAEEIAGSSVPMTSGAK